jgi:hypothetical protein
MWVWPGFFVLYFQYPFAAVRSGVLRVERSGTRAVKTLDLDFFTLERCRFVAIVLGGTSCRL